VFKASAKPARASPDHELRHVRPSAAQQQAFSDLSGQVPWVMVSSSLQEP